MQTLGPFQVIARSAWQTRLRAPGDLLSPACLAAVRRRLMACDGIEEVAVGPDAGSVVVRHTPAFRWSSVGPAALRLDDGPAMRRATRDRSDRHADLERPMQPTGLFLEDVFALALEVALVGRPPRQVLLEIALKLLSGALHDPRRI